MSLTQFFNIWSWFGVGDKAKEHAPAKLPPGDAESLRRHPLAWAAIPKAKVDKLLPSRQISGEEITGFKFSDMLPDPPSEDEDDDHYEEKEEEEEEEEDAKSENKHGEIDRKDQERREKARQERIAQMLQTTYITASLNPRAVNTPPSKIPITICTHWSGSGVARKLGIRRTQAKPQQDPDLPEGDRTGQLVLQSFGSERQMEITVGILALSPWILERLDGKWRGTVGLAFSLPRVDSCTALFSIFEYLQTQTPKSPRSVPPAPPSEVSSIGLSEDLKEGGAEGEQAANGAVSSPSSEKQRTEAKVGILDEVDLNDGSDVNNREKKGNKYWDREGKDMKQREEETSFQKQSTLGMDASSLSYLQWGDDNGDRNRKEKFAKTMGSSILLEAVALSSCLGLEELSNTLIAELKRRLDMGVLFQATILAKELKLGFLLKGCYQYFCNELLLSGVLKSCVRPRPPRETVCLSAYRFGLNRVNPWSVFMDIWKETMVEANEKFAVPLVLDGAAAAAGGGGGGGERDREPPSPSPSPRSSFSSSNSSSSSSPKVFEGILYRDRSRDIPVYLIAKKEYYYTLEGGGEEEKEEEEEEEEEHNGDGKTNGGGSLHGKDAKHSSKDSGVAEVSSNGGAAAAASGSSNSSSLIMRNGGKRLGPRGSRRKVRKWKLKPLLFAHKVDGSGVVRMYSQETVTVIGTLETNKRGTGFEVFGPGVDGVESGLRKNPGLFPASPRKHMASIDYDVNLLGTVPRKLVVRLGKNLKLIQKVPTFNRKIGGYALKFEDPHVRLPSKKNFILLASQPKSNSGESSAADSSLKTVVLCGKMAKSTYRICIHPPVTLVQGFGIILSAFYKKALVS